MHILTVFFDFAIFLFMIRLLTKPERSFSFNPFVTAVSSATDNVLAFIRSFFGLPERGGAVMAILLCFAVKTLFLHKMGSSAGLTVGSLFTFAPSREAAGGFAASVGTGLAGTLLFVFRVWTVFLFARLLRPPGDDTRAMDAFAYFCRPLSRLRAGSAWLTLAGIEFLFLILLTQGCRLTSLTPAGKTGVALFGSTPVWVSLLKTGWLTALALADGIYFLNQTLFALVVGSLLFSLTGWMTGLSFVNEWIDLVLGRFRVARQVGGMLDFRPVVFFLLANLVYALLSGILSQMILMPLSGGLA